MFFDRLYSASAFARNAERCNIHGRSVRPSVCPFVRHVPVFCPDEWRYDHAVYTISGRTIIL